MDNIGTSIIVGIAFVICTALYFIMGSEVVETGYRGIETHFGKVQGETLSEGLYFFNPFTSSIVEMDTRTQRLDHSEQAYTKDIQQSTIAYTVNFNLRKDKAHIMYQEVGREWKDTLVPQVVSGTLKGAVGKWNAVDLISNRDKATAEIEAAIKAALAEKNVDVTKFEITNIDYNDEFEKAVEAKVTAIERAKESENKTKQVEEEAKQRVISAKAEAESMTIRANALTQNKALVEYEAVQKWSGTLPNILVMGSGGALPLINLPTSAAVGK